jgi:two-component system alkaline phosphatase synthesis response regulator PhoP
MPAILVVDDEPVFRETVTRLLQQEGYQVFQAENGEEAMAYLGRADLVVLDINMPRLGGLELLEIIREYDRDLPVLMLTAYDREEDRVKGLSLGADDYMGKPLRPESSWPGLGPCSDAPSVWRASRWALWR